MERSNLTLFLKRLWYLLAKKLLKTNWKQFSLDLFRRNLPVKFLSFFFALSLFVVIKMRDLEEKTIFVPLRLEKSEALALANPLPENITVFLSGTRNRLFDIDINKVFAQVNLVGEPEGEYELVPRILGLPEGVRSVKVSPSTVEVVLSSVGRKILNVEPEFSGVPDREFKISSTLISPKRLWVSGPEEILRDLTSLKTEPISVDGLKANKEFEVALNRSLHPSVQVDRERKFMVELFVKPKYLLRTAAGGFPLNISFDEADLFVSEAYFISNVEYKILETEAEDFVPAEEFFFFLKTARVERPGSYLLQVAHKKLEAARVVNFSPSKIRVEVQRPEDE